MLQPTGRPRRLTSFLPLALLFTFTSAAQAAVYVVGSGAGCTHADLLSALVAAVNNPGFDEIRLLAGSTHQGQFLINTDGLSLIGGFASCTATSPTGRSTLAGNNSSRALFVNVSGVTSQFEKLDITGGSVTGNGGGMSVQGSTTLLLYDVRIFGNQATGKGGNLYVSASPGLVVRLARSWVAAGDALDGGGIGCVGDGRVLLQDSLLINNAASHNGGGAWLGTSCDLTVEASDNSGNITTNIAQMNGGGVYIEGGAELNTFLAPPYTGLNLIQGNLASNSGGGFYVTGTGSVVRAFYSRISGNQALVGGAFVAENGPIVAVGRPVASFDICPDPARCSLIDHNTADVAAGFWANNGADITIHGTLFEANSAMFSIPLGSLSGGSTALIHSSVFAANQGPVPFYSTGAGTSLTLANVTAVGNTGAELGFIEPGADSASTTVRVLASIFDHDGPLFFSNFSPSFAPQLNCVLSRSSALFNGLPANTNLGIVTTGDPLLANPAAGNYHLRGGSPAIDFCDLSQWDGGERDFEADARPLNDPGTPNFLGTLDLGADEYAPLFADGFESGNTAAWSLTVN